MRKSLSVIIVCFFIIGCASTNKPAANAPINLDPYENYNRRIFRMNMALDKSIVRPISVWYVDYVPTFMRSGVTNFFNNLRDFVTLGNDVLQLEGLSIMQNTMRISLNTVVGLFGLIDVSSSLGLPMHSNSFGKTLRVYGWKNSSYFILPVLGSTTIRDGLGMVPDVYFNPTWLLFSDNYVSVGLYLTNAINTRGKYLGIDQTIERSSLDLYDTIRDAYLQSVEQNSASSATDSADIDDIINTNETESAPNSNSSDIDEIIDEEIQIKS